MKSKFKRLDGDINWKEYGGTWYRDEGDGEICIIEIINIEDAAGEHAVEELGGKYLGKQTTLYPASITAVQKKNLITSVGEIIDEEDLIRTAYSYGLAGAGEETISNNAVDLLKFLKS